MNNRDGNTFQGGNQTNLVLCSITGETSDVVEVSVFADMMAVKTFQEKLPSDDVRNRAQGRGQRGMISTFSKKSRKRLMEAFAKKTSHIRPLFLTLTYPDEIWFGNQLDLRDVKNQLIKIRKRLLYKYGESCGLLWRIEFETRKSGEYIGEVAPHFHLILDGILDDLASMRHDIRQAWTECIDAGALGKSVRIDLKPAKSKQHAYYYLSKYVAKTMKDPAIIDFLENHHDDLGRFWGVAGNWDRSVLLVVRLSISELKLLRRLCSKWLKSFERKYHRRLKRWYNDIGFSIFGLGGKSQKKCTDIFESTIMKMLVNIERI